MDARVEQASNMNVSIPLELGDTLVVGGESFVLTEVTLYLNKPSTLIVKQPIELMKEEAHND